MTKSGEVKEVKTIVSDLVKSFCTMGRFRIRLTCQTSPTRQTSTRCVVGFLKSGFNGFNWCAFWKSTSQQVNELLRGRIFEDSKFRVFEDSIFSMGVGEGVKKK